MTTLHYPRIRNAVNRVITKLGESIIIRQRTVTHDTNDDPVYTNTNTTVSGLVVVHSIQESLESAGVIRAGDATILVKHTTNVSEGDLVKHQGIWYRVKGITPSYQNGSNSLIQCVCSPMEVYPTQEDEYYIFYGTNTSTTIDAAGIVAFPTSVSTTVRSFTESFDCTGGKYIWVCYPTSFGEGTFTFNTFTTTFVKTTVTDVEDPEGRVMDYYAYRCEYLQHSSSITVEVS